MLISPVIMNTCYNLEDLPDTQPFSPEDTTSAEFDRNRNENEESQSLLAPFKNVQKNKSDFASSSNAFDGINNLQSQQLFTETETYTVHDESKGKTIHKETETVSSKNKSQPIFKSAKKRCRSEEKDEDVNESEDINESHLRDENILSGGVNCPNCIFEKELDKRNYYFGNLLIGELQFLPPCMRSEAYVTILQYVDSLKRKHRSRANAE